MKLFIHPDSMKAMYEASPEWLKQLMNAYADGLNYYLHKNPQVKPRVITRFEPWMALTFSEGSVGGDIESISLGRLEAFYGKRPVTASVAPREPADPTASTGIAIAPSHCRPFLLLSILCVVFFREGAGQQRWGPERLWDVTWGQFFV